LVLLVAVVPAVLLGGGLGFVLFLALGVWGAAIGVVVASAVLFAEAAAAVYFLGKGFDRFDVTE
ncbi:MAG: ABC transporter permease, partial [Myxococcaceae bacterium]